MLHMWTLENICQIVSIDFFVHTHIPYMCVDNKRQMHTGNNNTIYQNLCKLHLCNIIY